MSVPAPRAPRAPRAPMSGTGYSYSIDEIPKIDFPVLTRIRGLFIGP